MANPDDKPSKLSFEEALNSLTIFFVDEQLEGEVEDEINQLIQAGQELKLQESHALTTEALSSLLQSRQDALQIVLREIGLSEEKFLRVVSVLRQQGIVADKLDREWNLKQVTQRLQKDAQFASTLASLFLEGHCDLKLRSVIPRYYLDMLNLRAVTSDSPTARRARYKAAMIGTYSSRKGYYVESRIQAVLQRIGVSYGRGRSSFVNVNVDFAVPSLEDPLGHRDEFLPRNHKQWSEHKGARYAECIPGHSTLERTQSREACVRQLCRWRRLVGAHQGFPTSGRKLQLLHQSSTP